MSKTVGIIIIGDEILKGRIIDENSNFLLKRINKLGMKVSKLSIISDDVDGIAREVSEFSKLYDFVITTGGTGPTHDDVTYAGVAKAFNEELVINPELQERVFHITDERCTDILKNPAMKMALIPKSARVLHLGRCLDIITVVCLANVYIFPGIPSYLHCLFDEVEHVFKSENGHTLHAQCLYLNIDELQVVTLLNTAVEKFKDCVSFGSYPILDNSMYVSKITIDSYCKYKMWEAEEYIVSRLPERSVVKKDNLHPDDIISSVFSEQKALIKNRFLLEKVKSSVKVIEECFRKYDVSTISISFNGGKDCTVLLHMACAVMWHTNRQLLQERFNSVYIRYNDPFPEVEDFIKDSVKRYNLNLKVIPGPIKEALSLLLKDDLKTEAILMGTRRTDPYSVSLSSFQMTDPDWPQVMRVHPILDWTFQDIWVFLRHFDIPYCSLYDKGYTSIGSQKNTSPNPRLQYINEQGVVKYNPAYLLDDESSERSGRN